MTKDERFKVLQKIHKKMKSENSMIEYVNWLDSRDTYYEMHLGCESVKQSEINFDQTVFETKKLTKRGDNESENNAAG